MTQNPLDLLKAVREFSPSEQTELNPISNWQGVQTKWKRASKAIFTSLKPHYIHRFDVEQDNNFTQVITYVLVSRGDAILAYRRGTYNRADKFLQGAFCVGFGGHVVENDLNLFNTDTMGVFDCAARELIEELKLPEADIQRLVQRKGLEIIGIINDDSSDVGRRHIAFVMQYEVSGDPAWNRPERGEKAITQLQWISEQQPGRNWLWSFEYWSQLCIKEFRPGLVKVRPAFRLLRKSPLKPPHILVVIGQVGSGKTQATEVLKNDFGYKEVNSGKVMAALLGIPPVPITPRREFQEKAWKFITQPTGPQLLASRLVEVASSLNSHRVLIDGIRQWATIENIKYISTDKRVGIIFVHTPADQAYSFYSTRIAQGETMSEFLATRSADVEREVEGLISKADAVLYNWTGQFHYRETIKALMEKIGVSEDILT